jgi:predicted Zn-dependent protease
MTTPARSVHFASLVAKQPDNALFRFSLAQALLNEKREADAVEHLVQCAAGKADWMMPRILLGKALLHLGRKAEAKPWLVEALTLAIEQDHQDPEGELRALLAGME